MFYPTKPRLTVVSVIGPLLFLDKINEPPCELQPFRSMLTDDTKMRGKPIYVEIIQSYTENSGLGS